MKQLINNGKSEISVFCTDFTQKIGIVKNDKLTDVYKIANVKETLD